MTAMVRSRFDSDVYNALAICAWLGRTIQSFLHESMV